MAIEEEIPTQDEEEIPTPEEELSTPQGEEKNNWKPAFWAAIAAIVILIGFGTITLFSKNDASKTMQKQGEEIQALQSQLHALQTSNDSTVATNNDLKKQLQSSKQDLAQAGDQSRGLSRKLEKAQAALNAAEQEKLKLLQDHIEAIDDINRQVEAFQEQERERMDNSVDSGTIFLTIKKKGSGYTLVLDKCFFMGRTDKIIGASFDWHNDDNNIIIVEKRVNGVRAKTLYRITSTYVDQIKARLENLCCGKETTMSVTTLSVEDIANVFINKREEVVAQDRADYSAERKH